MSGRLKPYARRKARYNGRCSLCSFPITPSQVIVKWRRMWVHAKCDVALPARSLTRDELPADSQLR